MGEENDEPTASEKAVQDQLGEVSTDPIVRATEDARPHASLDAAESAMEDPSDHEAVPFENEASNPASTGPEGLEGDWGVSSERTTAQHPRTDGGKDVSLGHFGGADVSQPDFAGHEGNAPEQADDDNRTWDHGKLATSGEPKPAPIQDEKLRREGGEPPPK
ncbi:hypothetical protein [Nocardioides marmoribigeumensis]|jgi:hypothetical protein|uniref:Uncharacterized protein n=1 Tax=Nocardioides marmoribigeumensis TaxID=433649 RepID=A0ABU2BPC8_9ACTN|nr:hypothetical protein [Nocardioides marmoribigeumensis]MDR7360485.1 hypothetical protein [Nocardioides marmoribigeumensis]